MAISPINYNVYEVVCVLLTMKSPFIAECVELTRHIKICAVFSVTKYIIMTFYFFFHRTTYTIDKVREQHRRGLKGIRQCLIPIQNSLTFSADGYIHKYTI